MRDEELKRLSERLNWIAARTPEVQARAYKAIEDLRHVTEVVDQQQEAWDEAVGAELVRLEAENAALRDLVKQVAQYEPQNGEPCSFCRGSFRDHIPWCPVEKARALLGKADAK